MHPPSLCFEPIPRMKLAQMVGIREESAISENTYTISILHDIYKVRFVLEQIRLENLVAMAHLLVSRIILKCDLRETDEKLIQRLSQTLVIVTTMRLGGRGRHCVVVLANMFLEGGVEGRKYMALSCGNLR